MRFLIASTYVPFINGGARFIVEWLEETLRAAGHEAEHLYLPFVEDPQDLIQQTAALRLIDLSDAADRLICVRPPAHVLIHPHKMLWFIHHIRAYYDLWGTEYGPEPTPQASRLRAALHRLDTTALGEARKIYTNSQVVADRLRAFNGVEAEPLYPPLFEPERFAPGPYGDEIVAVCRLEAHKRQHLLIESMARTRTPVRLRICGVAANPAYRERLEAAVQAFGLEERVTLETRWISEAEKAERLAGALAAAYLPADEDSYGYPSLEAAHAAKAVVTTTDSGGVLELVRHGVNGLVTAPHARDIAAAFDDLWADRAWAQALGEANRARLEELRIDWGRVVEAFTA